MTLKHTREISAVLIIACHQLLFFSPESSLQRVHLEWLLQEKEKIYNENNGQFVWHCKGGKESAGMFFFQSFFFLGPLLRLLLFKKKKNTMRTSRQGGRSGRQRKGLARFEFESRARSVEFCFFLKKKNTSTKNLFKVRAAGDCSSPIQHTRQRDYHFPRSHCVVKHADR